MVSYFAYALKYRCDWVGATQKRGDLLLRRRVKLAGLGEGGHGTFAL